MDAFVNLRRAGLILIPFSLLWLTLQAETIPGRYIVELSTEPVADHVVNVRSLRNQKSTAKMVSEEAISHRARIQSEQESLRSQLVQRNIAVVGTADTVMNAMFIKASAADAAQLATMPGVVRVLPVRKVKMFLDRAVTLTRVTDVWNQVGTDNAGAGTKIAIIDTGIDVGHAGFQDSSLTTPVSFPRANNSTDLAYTNSKVIVARSYVDMLSSPDPDVSARDRVGHGTALAMIAAGVRNSGPLATITGVAPKAWLGSYKVFGSPGVNDNAGDDAILKAMDDAVADGMDVISMSLGSDIAPRLADDPDVNAVERATRAGVIVIVSAGNNGPGSGTIASPATAPSAIATGASTNDRTFAANFELSGMAPVLAIPGDGPTSVSVTAPMVDVMKLDETGLACSALPGGSISQRIALIRRGTCTFETKLNNAQSAGAVAALVYAAEDSPDPINMSTGSASLPAEMVSFGDGQAIRAAIEADSSRIGSLRFDTGYVPVTPNLVTGFSSQGPGVDAGIKPDMLAVGGNIYTATQSFDRSSDMYSSNGYILTSGTSFSAPMIAGAAALLKSSRPGLTADQYRSLLINSSSRVPARAGGPASAQSAGAGLLDMSSALRATAAASPVSLRFGSGGPDASREISLTVSNVSSATETYSIASESPACPAQPVVTTSTIVLNPGDARNIPVLFTSTGLQPGACEGFMVISGTQSGTVARVPWWYGVASDVPVKVTILSTTESGRRGALARNAVLFRIVDAAGLPIPAAQPDVQATSGGATVGAIRSFDDEVPGMFGVDVRLGSTAGNNVLVITAGSASAQVSITGR